MDKVKSLVHEQYEKMDLANRNIVLDVKQTLLANKCQSIIYDDWGLGTQGLWDKVDECVKELIPDQYED